MLTNESEEPTDVLDFGDVLAWGVDVGRNVGLE
jgi:hypothetical protein